MALAPSSFSRIRAANYACLPGGAAGRELDDELDHAVGVALRGSAACC